jgi:hypothetical protein
MRIMGPSRTVLTAVAPGLTVLEVRVQHCSRGLKWVQCGQKLPLDEADGLNLTAVALGLTVLEVRAECSSRVYVLLQATL